MNLRSCRKVAGLTAMALLLCAAQPMRSAESSPGGHSRFSIGAGVGIPYGVIGCGVEMNPVIGGGTDRSADYFSINVGIGTAIASIGYSLGFRFYPWGRDLAWAPKFSLMYGAVAVINWDYLARGFSAGAGVVRKLKKKMSLDADLIFIINHFGFNYISWSDVGRLKVSCGLRWSLD